MIIAPEHPGTDTIKAPVLKVFDGDGFLTRIKTYEVTGNPRDQTEFEATVRCGFIDAPELEQPGGPEARAFLTSLIGDRWVELVVLTKMDTGRSVDRHGRIVCVPFLTEDYPVGEFRTLSNHLHKIETFGGSITIPRNIELEMVLNGWAWVMERYGPDERYFQALEDARHHKRGIWAFENNVHPWEFKKQKYRARTPQTPQLSMELDQREGCPLDGCGGHLVKRSGRFGVFFGCSKYPICKYTRPATA